MLLAEKLEMGTGEEPRVEPKKYPLPQNFFIHIRITLLPVSGAHFHRENLVDMKAMSIIRQTASELASHDVEQNMDSNITVRAQVCDNGLTKAYVYIAGLSKSLAV